MDNDNDVRPPVLYVESHPVHAMLMQALFERRPALRLLVASSGQEAVDMVDGLNPVLLLLDLNLPDCRGERLLPVLRQQPGCEGVPAVALTAEHLFDLEGTGFIELWTQPLHVSYVLGRLDRLVEASPRGGGNGTLQHWSSGAAIPAGMRF
jgi:CheY-like chemotaxis protein